MEWNKIDVNIYNLDSCNDFKKFILKFIRPVPNPMFNVDRSEGLKFLSRIRIRWSHSADHQLKHSFQGWVNTICSCGHKIETQTHFLLYLSNYDCARKATFEKVNTIDSIILKQNGQLVAKCFLICKEKLKATYNKSILTSRTDFLKTTEKFKTSSFN